MNLMKVKIKWKTQDFTKPSVQNDENEGQAVEAPRNPNDVFVNSVGLYYGNSCWYINEDRNWWEWCSDTTFRVKLKKNGAVDSVAWKRGEEDWVVLDTIRPPTHPPTLQERCDIYDGDPPSGPPAPCRWVVVGGKAYRIC